MRIASAVFLVPMLMLLLAPALTGCSDDAGIGLKLNEIQAANPDDDDWLEIYNDSDDDVSLAGVQLRDSNRYWTFSGGKLGAGAFLKVMCDGKGKAGSTNFKLSASGERLTLLDKENNKLDQVIFPALRSKTSWGRIPDGSGAWTALGTPSAGKANVAGAPGDAGITPDKGSTTKDGGKTTPDGGKTTPDSGKTTPDSGKTTPDSGKTAPDGGKTTPDVGKSGKDGSKGTKDSGKG